METPDLFIFAGEASGDLHGKQLLEELYYQNPTLKICGVGGPKMRSMSFDCLLPMEEFQVMGFSDVFFALPKLIRYFYKIRNYILEKRPKAVVFIDYPGFNLRMAKALREKGFKNKLIHYIAPTVWAWKKNRIGHMAKTLDLLLTIFPFENAYFKNSSLPCQYVGNPLIAELERHEHYPDWKEPFSLPETFFALFPGSRPAEIQRNLPLQLQAAKQLHLPYAISCAHPHLQSSINHIASQFGLQANRDFKLIPGHHTYDLMKDAAFAIAKSGTATLELALLGCPTVVTYKLSTLNYLLAKYVFRIRLPYYCLANILLNEMLFPEVIGKNLSASLLAEQAKLLDRKRTERATFRLKEMLSGENASLNAAKAILGQLA